MSGAWTTIEIKKGDGNPASIRAWDEASGSGPYFFAQGVHRAMESPISIIGASELNALGNGNTVTGTAGGTAGVFSATQIKNLAAGEVFLTCAGTFTPTAGGCISGWFLRSSDGGTTFEKVTSNTALARPPDFIIPLNAVAVANADVYFAAGEVRLPSCPFKVYVQNNTGVSLGASNHTMSLGIIGA